MKKASSHLFAAYLVVAAVLGCGVAAILSAQDSSKVPPPPDQPAQATQATTAGIDVMTRGPVHEAFAQPVNSGAVKPLLVPKKPPEAIEEVPPDTKPADQSATWIGGYWAWDDDRKDFTWISGVWRVPPPGERWVAGYWSPVPGGVSWVAGFWAPAGNQEVAYHPEPPASLEAGPTSESPSPDDVWITGCWRWADTRYVWQPGHWAEGQPDWVWIPASYYWTPRGWVFCNGYWDYRLDRRGLLFAPVYFTSAIYRRPGFVFSPSIVVDSGLLSFYLFVRPDYGHYYFGDFYAADYDRLGIFPWFAVRAHTPYAYDPLFSYYRWRNEARDPNWLKNLEGWHAYYRAHPDQRLPHDLVSAQRALAEAGNRPDRQFLGIADTLHNVRSKTESPIPLATVSPDERAKLHETSRLMRQFGTERGQMEAEGIAGKAAGAVTLPGTAAALKGPETLRLPKVAHSLTEDAAGRGEGNVRQDRKPMITPSEPKPREEFNKEFHKPVNPGYTPKSTEQLTPEIHKPVVPVQPPGKISGPPEKKPADGTHERVVPPAPGFEHGDKGDTGHGGRR